jgi:hypothetical protein
MLSERPSFSRSKYEHLTYANASCSRQLVSLTRVIACNELCGKTCPLIRLALPIPTGPQALAGALPWWVPLRYTLHITQGALGLDYR